MEKAYRAFIETDAMLVEINPLIVTPDGIVRALDSKYTVDDNALYRHPDIAAMRDVEAADPQEQMARERGVNYVKLDGDIGILGNGAGLVMSTLDVVARRRRHARPTSWTSAAAPRRTRSSTALEVLLSDDKVRAVLFNVFGGITRCDEVAQRHPGRARAARRERPDRRAAGRHQRRRGPQAAGRRGAAPTCTWSATMLGAAARVVELAGSAA